MAKKRNPTGGRKQGGGCLTGLFGLLCLGLLIETARRTKIQLHIQGAWLLQVGGALLALAGIFVIVKLWKRKKYGLYAVSRELRRVDRMDGREFEFWCAELLKRYGFLELRVTPGSNDQGVDIIGQYEGQSFAIQCKRYNSKLGNKPIQEVYTGAAFYACDHAAVMTNTDFTPAAKAAAERTEVLLWDRDVLKRLMEKANKRRTKAATVAEEAQALPQDR